MRRIVFALVLTAALGMFAWTVRRFLRMLAAARPQSRADRPLEVHVASAPADPRALEQLERAGVRRASPWIPAATRGPVERALDRFEAAVAEMHGE